VTSFAVYQLRLSGSCLDHGLCGKLFQ